MTEAIQTVVDAPVQTLALEQKFASGTTIGGVAPSLSGAPFVPYATYEDGIWRYKQEDDATKNEADAGGLFTLGHTQPVTVEQVLANLGSAAIDWTVQVVTSAGSAIVASGTGKVIIEQPKWIVMPGENIKITAAAATGKPWIRLYLRAEQARR